MKRIIVGFIIMLVLTSCAVDSDVPITSSMYDYDGTVETNSTILSGSESFGGQMIGNLEGTFIPDDRSVRAIAGNAIINIPDFLKRYPDVGFVEKKSYTFSSFKLVTDIILQPDDFISDFSNSSSWILSWGGGSDDLAVYIDLATGEFSTTEQPSNLFKTVYDSVIFQINAPAETIIPDFGNDTYNKSIFSWGDLKPFSSTNSSAQHVIYSTYITEPFVSWLGVKSANFDNLATVQEFLSRSGHQLVDFEDWAFNAPLNQEFFDEITSLNLTEDPNSGEAWIMMPLRSAIDLTAIDNVTFSFEFFMKHLMEVFKDADGETYYMLGSAKNFQDQLGDYFYGPLPIRISYKSNINGFTVDPLP